MTLCLFYEYILLLDCCVLKCHFGLFENCNMNSRKIHKILKFNKNKIKLGCVISCGLMKTKRQYTRESVGLRIFSYLLWRVELLIVGTVEDFLSDLLSSCCV